MATSGLGAPGGPGAADFLPPEDREWLRLLAADWGLLADLSFSDLVLWVPVGTDELLAVAQRRPSTGPTAHHVDLVGTRLRRENRPLLDAALLSGLLQLPREPQWEEDVGTRQGALPVVRSGRVVAVIAVHTDIAAARTPGRLELTYQSAAKDLAMMVAEGTFPSGGPPLGLSAPPRVGDGLARLDAHGTVVYASPNTVSAFRRLGFDADLVGAPLGMTTEALAPPSAPVDEALRVSLSGRRARGVEVEGADGVTVAVRVIPLLPGGTRTGALVLVRDVTDLRRRERALMTKDATIREIHHRVKNNLQTVAALLRLQARRTPDEGARQALAEAERRVHAIAVVHETLSQGDPEGLGDAVDGDQVLDRLLSTVGIVSARGALAAAPPTIRRTGTLGALPAHVATPLALVLTELVQNAVEHGLSDGGGSVGVHGQRVPRGVDPARLVIQVSDDGRGLPEGFDLDASPSLGLQIVRTLVRGELRGELTITPQLHGGVLAEVDVPLE